MILTTIIPNAWSGEPWTASLKQLFDHKWYPNGLQVEICIPLAGQYDRCWLNMDTTDTFGSTTIDHGNLPANWIG